MIDNNNSILGCFVSTTANSESQPEEQNRIFEQGKIFRSYIWGEKGICDTLKQLNHEDYGKDLKLALFQFYVNPIQYKLENLKEIESYRKNEKSIGIPIIINDKNFFSKSEKERYAFLRRSIFEKLDVLAEVVKKKKLDTRVDILKAELDKIWKI